MMIQNSNVNALNFSVQPCNCLYVSVITYLKMWIGNTFRDLFEQRLLDFLELCWLNNI